MFAFFPSLTILSSSKNSTIGSFHSFWNTSEIFFRVSHISLRYRNISDAFSFYFSLVFIFKNIYVDCYLISVSSIAFPWKLHYKGAKTNYTYTYIYLSKVSLLHLNVALKHWKSSHFAEGMQKLESFWSTAVTVGRWGIENKPPMLNMSGRHEGYEKGRLNPIACL